MPSLDDSRAISIASSSVSSRKGVACLSDRGLGVDTGEGAPDELAELTAVDSTISGRSVPSLLRPA